MSLKNNALKEIIKELIDLSKVTPRYPLPPPLIPVVNPCGMGFRAQLQLQLLRVCRGTGVF